MSMPSSRLLVATIAFSRPALRSDSITSRCSRESEPWCARTSSSPARSLRLRGQPLREPTGVAEDEGRVVLADQLDQPRVDVRPDARPRLDTQVDRPVGRAGVVLGRRVLRELGHVVDGDDDLELQLLARTGVDDRDRTGAVRPEATEEPRDLVERTLRRGEADALRRAVRDLVEPFEAQHEVRTALGGRHRVDLVDDHVLDGAQRLTRARRQHEVQRLGRRDQDVGRRADERLPVLARRVTGAHPDGRRPERDPEPLGREADARDRRAQVLLDVDGERAQRRDVEHTAPVGLGRLGRGREPVDRPEERGEGLARPGRRQDQRVVAGRDRRPSLLLGRRGRGEARLEPGADGLGEAVHGRGSRRRRHPTTVPASADRECQGSRRNYAGSREQPAGEALAFAVDEGAVDALAFEVLGDDAFAFGDRVRGQERRDALHRRVVDEPGDAFEHAGDQRAREARPRSCPSGRGRTPTRAGRAPGWCSARWTRNGPFCVRTASEVASSPARSTSSSLGNTASA